MVARRGTVSAAAEALGVHRATVNRHIDLLEESFGAPLFQRHARGYTLTETGQHMLEVAARAEEMFTDLAGRSRARAGRLSGKLIVTALSAFSPLILPAIKEFHVAHPDLELEFVAGAQLARLEHGEAHVAFRPGPRPETPDYVVGRFGLLRYGLYASRGYVERRGLPAPPRFEGHRFVGSIGHSSPLPYASWMNEHVSRDQLALFTRNQTVQREAVASGLGLGFVPEFEVTGDSNLVAVIPPTAEWSATLWVVTHVDLHRTEKVQEFLRWVRRLNPLPA
jgi:DNA-binding transcriptional LysR family regulator